MIIRNYTEKDEQGWLRCRVLSFLDTAYYDNVLQHKEHYENAAIELVAVIDEQVVGLIDIEYEDAPKKVCTQMDAIGGMIWHLAIHPDYQRQGIGEALLQAAVNEAKKLNVHYLEAWTRDDQWVQKWYEKNDFKRTTSYYHIYFEGDEMKDIVATSLESFYAVQTFGHYTGTDLKALQQVKRKHECVCYVKNLSSNS